MEGEVSEGSVGRAEGRLRREPQALSDAAQAAGPAGTSHDPARLLLMQFLSWVDTSPRSYADLQEAWRSTCPRLTIWEDAIDEDLVQFVTGPTAAHLALTQQGRALLEAGAAR